MTTIRTIEIDEVETEVLINFDLYFGDVEISKITNCETGDALGLEIDDDLYNELMEYAADFNAVKNYSRFNNED